MGWSGPVFEPPWAMGVLWSAVGLIGCGNLSVLSMGFPHQAQVRFWPRRSAARLLRYVRSLVRCFIVGLWLRRCWVGSRR